MSGNTSPFELLGSHSVEAGLILRELDRHPWLWGQFGRRKTMPGTPHEGMTDVWVRYNDCRPFEVRGDWSGFNDPHIPIWYPAATACPILKDYVLSVAGYYQAEMIGGVLITRIPEGHRIEPHTDVGWHQTYFDTKLYLSLEAPEGAVFGTHHGSITPKPGELWRFDNSTEHWVTNDGPGNRTTLIICLRTDYFRK